MIRILLVDDHEIVREGLKTILSAQSDFEVVGETGSAEGLNELVEVTRPDVVLLDARLPGMSGADACRALVAVHPEVAVLIVSTYTDDALVAECIAAGAKGYIVKDIERFTLEQSIRAVHRGEGAISPTIAAKMLDRLRRNDDIPLRQECPLTDSQLEIVRLIADGFSNREIADQVHLSENTIKSHVQEIFRRLKVRNRVEAALRASDEGCLRRAP